MLAASSPMNRLKNAPVEDVVLSGNFMGSMSRMQAIPAAIPSRNPSKIRCIGKS